VPWPWFVWEEELEKAERDYKSVSDLVRSPKPSHLPPWASVASELDLKIIKKNQKAFS
jgi:hypothetical protein